MTFLKPLTLPSPRKRGEGKFHFVRSHLKKHSLSPLMRGEGWGEGKQYSNANPLTLAPTTPTGGEGIFGMGSKHFKPCPRR